MRRELPPSIAVAAAETHDVEAMLAPFADDAGVKDEGEEMRGRAAIRTWLEATIRKYRYTVTVLDAKESGGKTIVTGRVAGDFPGSPVELEHVFTLAHGKITRLEIE